MALWRSSLLRLALLLTLVLWALATLVASALYERSEGALLHRATAVLDELEDGVRELSDRGYGPVEDWDDLLASAGAAPLDVDADLALGPFLVAYAAAIDDALAGFRRAGDELAVEFMAARLWLLGEATAFAPAAVGPDLILELMEAEIPERFHDSLHALAAPRVEAWPENARWKGLSERARLERIIAVEDLHEPEHCIGWREADGVLEDANFRFRRETTFARDRARLVEVLAGEADAPERLEVEGACWLRELPVNDATLLLGVRLDDGSAALHGLRRARDEGLAAMLAVALIAAGLLARLVVGRLRSINDTFAAVAAGNIGARIPVGEGNDDFTRLARNVNASLDRLEQLMQGVRAVSDDIAHDLRTPLTRLRNRIEQFARDGGADPLLAEAVTDEADRLLAIFDGLLRIAQLEQGSYRRAFTDFDACAMVRDAVDLYEPSIAERGIDLVVDLPAIGMTAFGDRDLWLQAVSNLLDNALKYTPPGGRIDVELRQSTAGWSLVVADDGPGIPPGERDAVLERFHRLEAHRGMDGSGLGLSLVAAVCQLHDARLALGGEQGLTVVIEKRID